MISGDVRSRTRGRMSDKIEVENVNHPGRIARVDAVKYAAAKTALLAILSEQE